MNTPQSPGNRRTKSLLFLIVALLAVMLAWTVLSRIPPPGTSTPDTNALHVSVAVPTIPNPAHVPSSSSAIIRVFQDVLAEEIGVIPSKTATDSPGPHFSRVRIARLHSALIDLEKTTETIINNTFHFNLFEDAAFDAVGQASINEFTGSIFWNGESVPSSNEDSFRVNIIISDGSMRGVIHGQDRTFNFASLPTVPHGIVEIREIKNYGILTEDTDSSYSMALTPTLPPPPVDMLERTAPGAPEGSNDPSRHSKLRTESKGAPYSAMLSGISSGTSCIPCGADEEIVDVMVGFSTQAAQAAYPGISMRAAWKELINDMGFYVRPSIAAHISRFPGSPPVRNGTG